jgi:cyclopropane fatty-acyl-phospholipid synthase-like methyltransferase
MIYTSGIISDPNTHETLEQLQDNKLAVVCSKIGLKEGDRLLDIGCGWGTLVTFAAKNYGCHATGVSLSKNQCAFARERLAKNGVPESRGRILCCDYREIPEPAEEGSSPSSLSNGHAASAEGAAFGWSNGKTPGRYDKITALEMAEHVGIRRYPAFLAQIYNLLEDDGIFFLQVAGFRECWYFEDLIWGLFMNKYIFPGADASCSLGWVVGQVQSAGFEVRSIDVLGVHYSATLWRWYVNWTHNEAAIKAKYGERWWRLWGLFLAWSTIISRQGSCSVFQLTLHKNLNAFHRVEGIKDHAGIKVSMRDLV